MTQRIMSAYDVDIDSFASNLHALADAMEEGDVKVRKVTDGTEATLNDTLRGTIEFEYSVPEGRSDLLRLVSYNS